jgi:nucleotide-binding universal stress UspA family protein
MRDFSSSSPAVVVGIDGSRTAVDAALWAVDEAVSRDIPLRLVYAIDPDNTSGIDPQTAARDLAAAEVAVGYAYTTVESTDKPVKIEVEILQERPGRALKEASKWAPMACVGAMGLRHSAHGRIGSTAAAFAASAHCPVAIVRGGHPNSTGRRWVVAEVDGSAASNGILFRAVEEARLREAPLRVLTSWQTRFTDVHDTQAVPDGNRLAKAGLDRQVAQWRKRYPDLDIETMAVHGTTLKHLTDKAGSIQLLVVGHERARGIRDLIGPPGYASLHETGCSVLICEPRNVL